jgi:hypothetical protein
MTDMDESLLAWSRTGLSEDDYHFYSRLEFDAAGVVRSLFESRKRVHRHNARIERAALWYALALDEECAYALDPTNGRILAPPSADMGTRYELQAGMRVVRAVIPFTQIERSLLGSPGMHSNFRFENRDAIQEQNLFNRWHEWLWTRDEDVARPPSATGESMILGEASARLLAGAQTILAQ